MKETERKCTRVLRVNGSNWEYSIVRLIRISLKNVMISGKKHEYIDNFEAIKTSINGIMGTNNFDNEIFFLEFSILNCKFLANSIYIYIYIPTPESCIESNFKIEYCYKYTCQ